MHCAAAQRHQTRQQRACTCQAAGASISRAAAKPAYPPSAGYGISEEEGDMPLGTPLQKGTLVARLLAAKEASGKTFSEIAEEVGLTNVYCTQLFYNQVRSSLLHIIWGRLQVDTFTAGRDAPHWMIWVDTPARRPAGRPATPPPKKHRYGNNHTVCRLCAGGHSCVRHGIWCEDARCL